MTYYNKLSDFICTYVIFEEEKNAKVIGGES